MSNLVDLETECFAHPWTLDNFEEYYNNSSANFYVAVDDDGTVVGYIGSYTVMDESSITNIAVTESARKLGVGTALVEKVLAIAELNRVSFVTLEVRYSNAPAIGLYKKLGFQIEGTRPGFYRDPDEDALIMTKRF